MSRADILEAARQAVIVDRAATHGVVEETFGLIARLWSARLDVPIAPHVVALMLVDLKSARAQGNPSHADNWVDIAGYAACGGELAEAAGVTTESTAEVRNRLVQDGYLDAIALPEAVAIAEALRDGLGVEDIEARGIATSDAAREVLRSLRDGGVLGELVRSSQGGRSCPPS